QPQTAFWHFGWHVTSERATMARLRADGVTLLPLYTGDVDRPTVNINSDTYPGTGGVLGLTRAQLEEAKKNNVKPAGGVVRAADIGEAGAPGRLDVVLLGL